MRVALLAAACSLVACSPTRFAVNVLGDALSGGGDAFASEEDPDLLQEALPFGLKTYESLLEVSPDHEGLVLASARGFAAYAFLLQRKADREEAQDLAEARRLRARAHRLYLRGRDYALRGLAARHPGFDVTIRNERERALAETEAEDVPLLYWGGAAWAGALSAARDDLSLIAELPIAAAMVRRVLALDEDYERGAAHEFFIAYEGGRPGGDRNKARAHYRRALDLSHGLRASTHLALATAVSVPEQNVAEFRRLIAAAKAVDVNAEPALRLVNVMARERADRLEAQLGELFLLPDEDARP